MGLTLWGLHHGAYTMGPTIWGIHYGAYSIGIQFNKSYVRSLRESSQRCSVYKNVLFYYMFYLYFVYFYSFVDYYLSDFLSEWNVIVYFRGGIDMASKYVKLIMFTIVYFYL